MSACAADGEGREVKDASVATVLTLRACGVASARARRRRPAHARPSFALGLGKARPAVAVAPTPWSGATAKLVRSATRRLHLTRRRRPFSLG